MFSPTPRMSSLVGSTLAGLAAWIGFVDLQASAEDAEPPLNVVFMMADDLGWGEVGCYGQEKIPTPNIDRLAAEGRRFTQHYSGAPTCAPSRCVLMTGTHLGHAEIRGNRQARLAFPEFEEGQHPISDATVTLAEVFQKAGYATGAFGKWGLGPVGSSGDPNRQGFDLFFGYNCQAVAHSYFPPHLWRNDQRVPLNDPPIPGHQTQPEGEVRLDDWIGRQYAPKVMMEQALQFLEDHRDQPFLLYLPFIEPHVAMHPPRERVEQFPEAWDTQPYRGENGYLPHPRPRAGYAAMINDLDRHVGDVLAKLDQLGLAERTLVVFTSDNGTTLGRRPESPFHVGGADPAFFNSTRHLRGFKGSLYEGGIRVPMIARLPGRIPAGTVDDTAGYFADWFPTLCEATGLESPERLDGVSLWPAVTGRPAGPRDRPMIWVYAEYGGQAAVRLGDFKVIRRGLKTATPGPWEVYDIQQDPSESHNLAPTRADLIAEARIILARETFPNATFPVDIDAARASRDSR